MDKILEAYEFTLGQYQDIANLMDRMAESGKDRHDLRAWINHQAKEKNRINKQSKQAYEEWLANVPKCKDCNSPMSTWNLEGEVIRTCKCGYSEYVKEIIKDSKF